MDDEEDADATARRQMKRGQPSPAKRKGAAPQPLAKPRLAPLGENETMQDRAPSPIARPQAPTPKKASSGQAFESPASVKPMSTLAPPRAPPAGPRPPLPSRGSSYTSSDSGGNPITPSIVLQEATPTKEMLPPSTIPSRPVSMVDPPSPSLSDAPPISPLYVPHVQDERLQMFFNEVASQLNTMNIRSSVASGSSNGSGSAILGSDYQSYLAYTSNGQPALSASPEPDPNQFADADDDETVELASIHSGFPPSSIGGPPSPLVGLGLGGPPHPSHGGRPGLYPVQSSTNTQRWSYASSTGSTHRGISAGSHVPESPQPYSPNPSRDTQPMQAQRPAPLTPRTASRPPPPPIRVVPVPFAESQMQRDGSYVVINEADLPASDPSLTSWGSKQSGFSAHRGQDGFGMLKKKKRVTIDPVPYASDSSGPATASSGDSATSPKRSWFNNLFSFKPPSCTLLSHDNIANTRERTRRMLGDLNVRVLVVELEGVLSLKCRLDEIRGERVARVFLGMLADSK